MSKLEVPATIDAVIQEYDSRSSSFTVHEIQSALSKARGELTQPTDPENLGTWAEVLAFSLTERWHGKAPCGTYFSPMGSAIDKDGKEVYFPDISQADASVVSHWELRSRQISNPVLKARYADLVWEMTPLIAPKKRDPEMARIAIDAYLAFINTATDAHSKFEAARRAF